MLKVSKPSSNRLDIELSGALNAETMNTALNDLISLSEGISNGRMLYTILDFDMPTLGALAVELRHMPKLFGLIGKFDKCAVLSNAGWIRTAAEIEGAVFPTIDIKSFPLGARQAAEDWLNGSEATAEEEDEAEDFPV